MDEGRIRNRKDGQELYSGTEPMHGRLGYSGIGGGGTTGAGTASVTSAAYAAGSTAATAVGDGGSSYTYSDWEWDDHYQRYKRYNYTAGE